MINVNNCGYNFFADHDHLLNAQDKISLVMGVDCINTSVWHDFVGSAQILIIPR